MSLKDEKMAVDIHVQCNYHCHPHQLKLQTSNFYFDAQIKIHVDIKSTFLACSVVIL